MYIFDPIPSEEGRAARSATSDARMGLSFILRSDVAADPVDVILSYWPLLAALRNSCKAHFKAPRTGGEMAPMHSFVSVASNVITRRHSKLHSPTEAIAADNIFSCSSLRLMNVHSIKV